MGAGQIKLDCLGSKSEKVKSCHSQFKLDPDQLAPHFAEFEPPSQRSA
jgi:hypothetical protein